METSWSPLSEIPLDFGKSLSILKAVDLHAPKITRNSNLPIQSEHGFTLQAKPVGWLDRITQFTAI